MDKDNFLRYFGINHFRMVYRMVYVPSRALEQQRSHGPVKLTRLCQRWEMGRERMNDVRISMCDMNHRYDGTKTGLDVKLAFIFCEGCTIGVCYGLRRGWTKAGLDGKSAFTFWDGCTRINTVKCQRQQLLPVGPSPLDLVCHFVIHRQQRFSIGYVVDHIHH